MRKKFGVLAMCMAVLLTGCSSSVPDLSKVDNDIAAQYMADALLQHDKEYDDSLVYDHKLLEPTPSPEPTVAPAATTEPTDAGTGDGGTGDGGASVQGTDAGQGVSTDGGAATTDGSNAAKQLQSVSLSELYGVDGVKITGGSYSVTKSYGTNYAVCTPKKGNKLLVVHFNVSNNTGKTQNINLQKRNIEAEALVNGKSIGKPLLSIVEGDLQYNTRIKNGRKKPGVLLFEVKVSTKVSDVQVQFVKGNNQAVVSAH